MIGLLSFILILIGFFLYKWRQTTGKEPPVYPGGLPIIGHAHHFLGNSVNIWEAVKKISGETVKRGGVMTINLGPKTVYMLADPHDALTVSNSCLEKDELYDLLKPWLGNGLVTAPTSIWKHHRKILGPAFSSTTLHNYVDVFNKQAKTLVHILSSEVKKGAFDHFKILEIFTLQSIFSIMVGINDEELKAYEKKQYISAMDEMFTSITYRMARFWLRIPFVFRYTGLKDRQDDLVKILTSIIQSVIQKKMTNSVTNHKYENLETKTSGGKAFLDYVLEISKNSDGLTVQDINDEVNTVVSGSFQSISLALAYTLKVLGFRTDIQDQLYKELQDVLGSSNRDVDKTDLSQLVYLDAVVKECLRYYPVAPVISRHIDKDVKLKNFTLKAGNNCIISLYGLLRHPLWGADVENFNPDRWLNTTNETDINVVFAAFGLGRRGCVGKMFALTMTKVYLAHLLRQYRIEADNSIIRAKLTIGLKPVSGHHISIYHRNG